MILRVLIFLKIYEKEEMLGRVILGQIEMIMVKK